MLVRIRIGFTQLGYGVNPNQISLILGLYVCCTTINISPKLVAKLRVAMIVLYDEMYLQKFQWLNVNSDNMTNIQYTMCVSSLVCTRKNDQEKCLLRQCTLHNKCLENIQSCNPNDMTVMLAYNCVPIVMQLDTPMISVILRNW